MSVYEEVEDQELKDFLYEEYMCNDFAVWSLSDTDYNTFDWLSF